MMVESRQSFIIIVRADNSPSIGQNVAVAPAAEE
jgi:hypothetical protein